MKTFIKTFPSYCSSKIAKDFLFCMDGKLFPDKLYFYLLDTFSVSSILLSCAFSFLFISINATKYYNYSDYFLTIHSIHCHDINFASFVVVFFFVTYFASFLVSAIIFVFKLMVMFSKSFFPFLCLMFCAVNGCERKFIKDLVAVWEGC